MERRRPGWMSGIRVIGVLLGCLMTAEIAVAQSVRSTSEAQEVGAFRLRVTEGYVSLEAQEASVAKVFEEIGRQMGIEVDIHLGSEEKITIQLDRVPVEEALKRLAENVAIFYTKGPKEPTSRISKVGVYSRGQGAAKKEPGGSEPFKFIFDPAKFLQKPR